MPSQKSVRHKAMDLLARREHSRKELYMKLKQRDYSSTEIEDCLDQLEADKLLSDERFCEAYVRMRSRRGFGPTRILQELNERGIRETIAQAVLSEAAPNWLEIAKSVYQKKYAPGFADDFNELAKRKAFLQYRGFNHDTINQVIGEFR